MQKSADYPLRCAFENKIAQIYYRLNCIIAQMACMRIGNNQNVDFLIKLKKTPTQQQKLHIYAIHTTEHFIYKNVF